MFQAVKNQDNLELNTYSKLGKNLLFYTGSQFKAEDFMQGGQNEYLSRLYDQAENGLYVTKRVKELVEDVETGKVGLDTDIEGGKTGAAGEVTTVQAFVWKVKRVRGPIADNPGGFVRERDNTSQQFGISIEQITIEGFFPENDLTAFMAQKKERILKRAKIIEDQSNERQQAITAKLTGDRERIEAKQKQLMAKDKAVIAAQQKVEIEQQEAARQVVLKQKELDIARANMEIEKAAAQAAKFEAIKIKEVGLAEAAVRKAKYAAYNEKLYTEELAVRKAKALYSVLPSTTLSAPQNVVISGGGSDGSTGEAITNMSNMKLIEMMSGEKLSRHPHN
jgi:hypothetical protein